MSTSLGILPKCIAPGSRSAPPGTPRTRVIQPRRLPSPRPNLTAAVSHSPRNQTSVGNTKRISGYVNNSNNRKRKPCRRVYLGAPRCSRVGPYMLPPMFGYKNFGSSSDCTSSRSANANTVSQQPNPYTQLAKEVKQLLKQKLESSPQLNTSKLAGSPKNKLPENLTPGPVKMDIASKGETHKMVSGVVNSSDERRLKEQEAQESEICDDEEELYMELPSDENIGEATVQFETYRALHQSKMEDICKGARPGHLLSQLNKSGYFNYNYDGHIRAPQENPSVKPNTMKPIDRLCLLLSIY